MKYNAALPLVSWKHACSVWLDLAGMDNCIEREGRKGGGGFDQRIKKCEITLLLELVSGTV